MKPLSYDILSYVESPPTENIIWYFYPRIKYHDDNTFPLLALRFYPPQKIQHAAFSPGEEKCMRDYLPGKNILMIPEAQ